MEAKPLHAGSTDPDKLRSEYNAAAADLKRAMNTKKGGKKSEVRFSNAYQALVKAGLALKLKRKYWINK